MAKPKIFKKLLKNKKNEKEAEQEIISVVNEGHEMGVLNAKEASMIANIVEFDDKDAKDVMIHRKNVVSLDGNMTLEEAVHVINESSFSRYPVCIEDLDNIIGSIHIKQVLKFYEDKLKLRSKIRDIEGLVREVDFIPETNKINAILTKMQMQKNHLAIVVDEYGQTSGIISMEDILEEIVGNIIDENDLEEESIREVNDDEYRMDGMTSIEDVEEILGIKFEEEFETLNGFLIYEHGKIPVDNSSFLIKAYGYEFQILDVKKRIIQSVRVRKLDTNNE